MIKFSQRSIISSSKKHSLNGLFGFELYRYFVVIDRRELVVHN